MNDKENAEHIIKIGNKFPYDAPEGWCSNNNENTPPPPIDKAHATARGVLADLCDRRGVKQELDQIDADVRQELVSTVAEIIRVGMS